MSLNDPPLLEADWYRRADIENGLGKGLTGIEAGLRLKYLIRPNRLEGKIGVENSMGQCVGRGGFVVDLGE